VPFEELAGELAVCGKVNRSREAEAKAILKQAPSRML
jgi:hypothetical protein